MNHADPEQQGLLCNFMKYNSYFGRMYKERCNKRGFMAPENSLELGKNKENLMLEGFMFAA